MDKISITDAEDAAYVLDAYKRAQERATLAAQKRRAGKRGKS